MFYKLYYLMCTTSLKPTTHYCPIYRVCFNNVPFAVVKVKIINKPKHEKK